VINNDKIIAGAAQLGKKDRIGKIFEVHLFKKN
jgi:hypothetical protein